jgi:putative hemolysin
VLLEIVLIVILVLLNGVFSGTELALVSARRGRLQQRAEGGDSRALAVLQLQDDPNRLLSTVQIGITLIGTLAGAFGGANLAKHLALLLVRVPSLAGHAETLALGIVVAAIAYLSLVLGELVPKRLALQSAEAIATAMARPMLLLSQASRPVVALLTWSTEGLLRLLGRRASSEPAITEEDIKQIVREGTEEGIVAQHQQEMIESVFAFTSRIARRIMTPRNQIVGFDMTSTVEDVIDIALESGFSRFPVFKSRPDEIVGIVHVRDLLRAAHAPDSEVDLRALMREPLIIPESVHAGDLLTTFRRTRNHMGVVIDEHGSVEGLVTLEDVLEELVGEIGDEYDDGLEPAFSERPDGSLLIDGSAPIDQVVQRLGIELTPSQTGQRYDTLAGMLLSLLGRIPKQGDSTSWGAWSFEILDMDGLRIDKVLATRQAPENPDVAQPS